MHDAGGNRSETVAALPKIVEDLRARGYKLVTVPQLLLDNPPPANQEISRRSSSVVRAEAERAGAQRLTYATRFQLGSGASSIGSPPRSGWT